MSLATRGYLGLPAPTRSFRGASESWCHCYRYKVALWRLKCKECSGAQESMIPGCKDQVESQSQKPKSPKQIPRGKNALRVHSIVERLRFEGVTGADLVRKALNIARVSLRPCF